MLTLNEDGSSSLDNVCCDYPGCGEPATWHYTVELTIRQSWIGGRVRMGLHIFACEAHENSVQRFIDLVTEL